MSNGTRRKFSNAAAHVRVAARNEVFTYELSNTLDEDGQPYVVEARIPDPHDIDALANLPQPLQQAMFRDLNQLEEGGADGLDPDGGDDVSIERNLALINKSKGVVNFYLVAGFVDPTCHLTPEEADVAENGVWVGAIDYMDRIAFMAHCNGQTEEFAAKVSEFREQPDGPVHGGQAKPKVSGAGRTSGSKRTPRALAAAPGADGD